MPILPNAPVLTIGRVDAALEDQAWPAPDMCPGRTRPFTVVDRARMSRLVPLADPDETPDEGSAVIHAAKPDPPIERGLFGSVAGSRVSLRSLLAR